MKLEKIITAQYDDANHDDIDSKITFLGYGMHLTHNFQLTPSDDSKQFFGSIHNYNVKFKSALKPINDLYLYFIPTVPGTTLQSFTATVFLKIKFKD